MLSKKIQKLKPSITQALSAQAKELKAQGRDVVNLAMGEPTWDNYDWTKQQAVQAIEKGCAGYSPASGQMALREAIAEDVNRHLKLGYAVQQVTVSIGAKFICYSVLQALVNEGDEVLIPAPYWVSYPSMVQLSGAVPAIVETDLKTHKLTADILRENLNKKTRVLILNSPNNPSSVVYSLEELKILGDVLKNWPEVYILTDDIYNRMALDRPPSDFAPHILSACPELKERVIIVNSASKNYAMPGWRLGWAVGNVSIIKAMSAFQSQTVSSAPTAGQLAMISTFKSCESDVQKIHNLLRSKRDQITQLLRGVPGLEFQKPQGAFYLWLNVKGLFGKKYKDKTLQSSVDVFKILCTDQALFTVPGEEFGRSGYLRLYFAAQDKDIEKCSSRIKEFVSHLA